MTSRWLSLHHAAEHLDISTRTFERLVKKGTIPPPGKRGAQPFWDRYALDRMMGHQLNVLSEADILSVTTELPPVLMGVYFLIQDGCIVYVGQSRNILNRLFNHMRTSRFDAWHWIPCALEKLIDLEQDYIEALRPAWNKAGAA